MTDITPKTAQDGQFSSSVFDQLSSPRFRIIGRSVMRVCFGFTVMGMIVYWRQTGGW
jgi:hypothetical protein